MTLGDFTVKKAKREGKPVFNWKSIKLKRNVLCFRQTQLYVSHVCKRIFKFELQLSSYWQNIKFSRCCPKFHIITKIVIFQFFCNFLDQLLHPYEFYGRGMSVILFWPIPASRLWLKKWKISLLNGYSSWCKHAINKFLIDNSASCSCQDINSSSRSILKSM